MSDKKNSGASRLLVVEDDPGLQKQLRWSLGDYDPLFAEDRHSAIIALRQYRPPVVTLDLGLPPDPANASEGLATLDEILSEAPHTKVIVVTGNDDRGNALAAVARGAYDFYQKPVDVDTLKLIIDRAYNLHALEEENRRLASPVPDSPLQGVIAGSPAMLEVCRMIEKIASTEASILLLGESGTGKEVLARALHQMSQRNRQPFMAINCAAIPENLLESELFGYEKGAFTGASKQTPGRIEYADGGTLFLDEVGDLPLALQAKLLRFLQERVIERIGGRSEIPVDIRVICATHKDLGELIRAGDFREDLYYRIAEISVTIPPLRERGSDPVLIARAIIQQQVASGKARYRELDPGAIRAIEGYAWPGNVRELENRIKRALIMAEGKLITAKDLQLAHADEDVPLNLNLKDIRDRAEAEALRRALAYSDGHIGTAAELLCVSRPTIYHMMKKFGISV